MKQIICFFLLLLTLLAIFFFVSLAGATEINDNELADAIFWAEGGYKATYLYGIKSVKYRDIREARQICLNTIRNNRLRYRRYGNKNFTSFLEFLASRYCPVSAHPLNKHWLKNVEFFLAKKKGVSK